MSTPRVITLTPSFLLGLITNSDLRKRWPFFREMERKISNKKRACCGNDKIDSGMTDQIRQFLIAMPKPDLDELKGYLNIALTSRFVTFSVVDRRARKIEL